MHLRNMQNSCAPSTFSLQYQTGEIQQMCLCVRCKKEIYDPSSRLLECERCTERNCIKCMK